ncbi:MAG TPA: endolytic transglycosylase MltG [Candidatus Paceibacterota bacterium]|nr:endolytic transglycosylase MltG [Candidatus Paceibacterota bacterium]
MSMRRIGIAAAIILALVIAIGAILAYGTLMSAPGSDANEAQFTVPRGESTGAAVEALLAGGFIRNAWGFRVALGARSIAPGGYRLPKDLDAFGIAHAIAQGPDQVWVTIPEGLRKEEVGERLAAALGWSPQEIATWDASSTEPGTDYAEGVYFPDTYLMPKGASPDEAAARMRAHFEEEFAPFAKEALAQDIKWTTVLKIASLVQREAAGTSDMPLIAGIIWNRLEAGMPLQIDAMLQYAAGTAGKWWPAATPAMKSLDSPYNTYAHAGLPPTPIDEPGSDAIKAVLDPTTTTCLYYLHDSAGQIHCADTYAAQEANIETYLK